MGTRFFAGLAGGLLLVATIGCGGSSAPPASQGPSTSTSPGSAATAVGPAPSQPTGPVAATSCSDQAATDGAQISMEGTHSLNPSDATISVGQSVTWTNNSPNANHQIVFATGPACAITLIKKVVSIKFDTPGTYSYVCKLHPDFMKGTITVQ